LEIGPDYGRSFVCDKCDGKFATEVVHCDRCGCHRQIELDACVFCFGYKPRST
jgi:hypothetical protein